VADSSPVIDREAAVSLLCLAGLFLLQAPTPGTRPVASPSPVPSLEGTVKGPDGKPLADALVLARSLQMGDVPVSTRTDGSGRFQLKLRKPLTQVVRVEAQGFAGRTIEKVAAGAKLDINLVKGAALEGTVRDGTTGQPVPQARVEAQTEFAMTLPWEPSAGVTAATTDLKGHFRLERLSDGPQTIRAHARNIGAGRSRAIPGRPLEIYLFPSATIGGTVSGPGNLPIRGALVRAEKAGPRPGNAPLAVATDAQGRYVSPASTPASSRSWRDTRTLRPPSAGARRQSAAATCA
jgi:carboxypeptidase family protein